MAKLEYKQRCITKLYAILAVIFHKTPHNSWGLQLIIAKNLLCCYIYTVVRFKSALIKPPGIYVSGEEERCMPSVAHGMEMYSYVY